MVGVTGVGGGEEEGVGRGEGRKGDGETGGVELKPEGKRERGQGEGRKEDRWGAVASEF